MQQAPNSLLRAGVLAPDPRHVEASLFPCQDINHLGQPCLYRFDKSLDTEKRDWRSCRILFVQLGWHYQLHARTMHLCELRGGDTLLNSQNVLVANSACFINN